jgi:hypothetical protein
MIAQGGPPQRAATLAGARLRQQRENLPGRLERMIRQVVMAVLR